MIENVSSYLVENVCSYLVCLSAQPLLLRSDKLVTCSNLTLSLERGVPSNFRPQVATQFGNLDGPPFFEELISDIVMNIESYGRERISYCYVTHHINIMNISVFEYHAE